jgi:hypothetical protein
MTLTLPSWIIPTVATLVFLGIMFRPYRSSGQFDFGAIFRLLLWCTCCNQMKTTLSPAALQARAIIAGDLFREGRITRPECFRLEVDAAISRDTGPIEYERNTEYAELVADGVLPIKNER